MLSRLQQRELVDLLFRQSYAVLFANLVIPLPVLYIFRGVLSPTEMLVWLAVIYVLTLGRIVLARAYFRQAPAGTPGKGWLWSATVLSWASSLLWGWLGWIGFAHGDSQLLAFTCIVLTGLVCGAVPSLSASPPAYIGSLAAMLLPLLVLCLTRSGEEFTTYSFFILCLAAANLYYSRVSYRNLCETIRLRQENSELVQDLKEQRDRAQAADRAKTRFLAAASHDLRQPIHALGLFVGALASLAERGPVNATQARDIATRLRAMLGNLGDLLNGLLDISRLDAGVVPLAREPIALQRLFADLQLELAGTAAERNLSWRVCSSRLWVDSDPVLLKRLLDNLLSNAFRYTHSGGVLLGCRRRGRSVEIQVLDTGIGIHPSQQEIVFDEFVQLHNAERDRKRGLGLGLAIVRHTARLLGHGLRLESQPGRGSLFAVRVPLAQAPSQAPRQGRAPDELCSGLGIMVVEDEQDVLDALTNLLEVWGHRVYPGASALLACQRHIEASHSGSAPIDLILSDYRLGSGQTGADAIRRIRSYLSRQVPALIITGDTSPERIREAAASGAHLLYKPLDTELLREAINASQRRSESA
ncbi:ATP-binding protein [Pseudomonas sp. ZM23]|uniref:histidine kinase n=1 Tax=Pseudomonas triclosanedens TaxID=2961893 RepID=A0ABY7A303_9PSED|nr:hybrid sensor histidine kinase/response regulator [Pseudomonas triclosanedens]MCP8464930.1 ATP-binding protein [Pseudomonas triclosanedens]MCP8470358.1 ATP-binding protein [Pseudomonas triclosanedens]MCP8476163.1 ATP-binding protein [Pseudomonas triclosanedens]WAI51604.1 ATP-binding protein [Pseudomonas triclosanedens]